MNPHLAWYIARSTGFVAWGLLTASIIFGLLLSTRLAKGYLTPAWILDLHRFLGGASVMFTVAHVVGAVADNNVHFGPIDVLVPFASEWRPAAVALGIVAMYLLIAIEITSLLMKRLSRSTWRRVHMTSYVLFWIATFHLLLAGSDASAIASRVVVMLTIGTIVFLTLVRLLADRRRSTRKSVAPRSAPSFRED